MCEAGYYIFNKYIVNVPAWPAYLWLNLRYLELEIGPVFFTGPVQRVKKNLWHREATETWTQKQKASHLKHPSIQQAPFAPPNLWMGTLGTKNVPDLLPSSWLVLSCQWKEYPSLSLLPVSRALVLWLQGTHIDFSLAVHKEQDYQSLFFLGKIWSFMAFFLKLRLRVTKIWPQMSQWDTPSAGEMASSCLTFILWSQFQRHFISEALLGPGTIYVGHTLLSS